MKRKFIIRIASAALAALLSFGGSPLVSADSGRGRKSISKRKNSRGRKSNSAAKNRVVAANLRRARARRFEFRSKSPAPIRFVQGKLSRPRQIVEAKPVAPANSGLNFTAPAGWNRTKNNFYQVTDANGGNLGTAEFNVVNVAPVQIPANSGEQARKKYLGNFPLTVLRHNVIERLVREGGWIVNDYKTQIAGQNTFVVVAQNSKDSVEQAHLFYFVETGEKIYLLATSSPVNLQDKMKFGAENMLAAFARSRQPVLPDGQTANY